MFGLQSSVVAFTPLPVTTAVTGRREVHRITRHVRPVGIGGHEGDGGLSSHFEGALGARHEWLQSVHRVAPASRHLHGELRCIADHHRGCRPIGDPSRIAVHGMNNATSAIAIRWTVRLLQFIAVASVGARHALRSMGGR